MLFFCFFERGFHLSTLSLSLIFLPLLQNSVEDPPESLCPLSSSSSPSENPIGSTVCACQPTEWDFTLDFTNPCPPGNNGNTNNTNNSNNLDDFDSIVVGLPHLHECFPPVLQEGVVDDVNFDETLGIDAIYVLELNSTLQTIEQTTIPGGPFFNGDTFSYQSLLNNINASLFTVDTLPAGLVLIFAGNNSLGQRITASWSVQFSTSCDPYAPDSPVVPPPPQETETLLTRIVSVHVTNDWGRTIYFYSGYTHNMFFCWCPILDDRIIPVVHPTPFVP